MIYGSVCSGIEAATVAWHPLGWRPAFYSEIAKFPRAVLTHHYPTVPLRGDFTEIKAGEHAAIDLLVGGTPCQSFSVAGLRGGLDDDRGVLALEYLRLAGRLQPRWLVWENVPGALSIDEGRAFGAILGGLEELGYGWAYRVLDAQYFGVPQRRRRVFVVGCAGGSWQRAAAVLFERASLRGDPEPVREPGTNGRTTRGLTQGVGEGGQHVASTVLARKDGWNDYTTFAFDAYNTLTGPVMSTLSTSPKHQTNLVVGSRIRRLTPLECERLQGFPDGYTAIPGAIDGHRYKAIGNSMAVPVMRWLGRRIALVDDIR